MKLADPKHTVNVPVFEKHGFCTVSETDLFLRCNLTFVPKRFPVISALILGATYRQTEVETRLAAGITQSVQRLATAWWVWGSNPGVGEIPSRTALRPTRPVVQWVMGLFFRGIKRPGSGVDHPPPSSAGLKDSRAVLLFPRWAWWTLLFAFLMEPRWFTGKSAYRYESLWTTGFCLSDFIRCSVR